LPPIRLSGLPLKYASQVKYLGLHITPKLLWNIHIQEKVKAAQKALWQVRRAIRCTWGVKPSTAKWLYEAVIRPMVTYGCIFWHESTQKVTLLRELNKVQRLGCILTLSALCTVPLVPLEVISGILPIDLYIRCRAICTARRLSELDLVWPWVGSLQVFAQSGKKSGVLANCKLV